MLEARRSYRKLIPGAGLLVLLSACTTTPVTGSRTFNLFSASDDVELGREAYGQILAGERLVTSGPELQRVRRVMQRLVAVADDAGYEWEVTLIDDDQTVNAFALPGGKMAVYTGILPVCQNEAGLAVVMGHEIGHVVAQDGSARITRSIGVEGVRQFLNLGKYDELAQTGVSLLLEMPYGRKDESEADHIGLIYMARAGYDPREAVAFWGRMAQGGGGGPPEFLSTHPSHESRIQRLGELMPDALEVWQAAGGP